MSNEEYMKFMTDKKNTKNCSECPENKNMDAWQDRLPCGQWHCWVTLHTRDNKNI